MELNVPADWRWLGGAGLPRESAMAEVRGVALVVTIPGRTERYALTDAVTYDLDCFQLWASFEALGKAHPIKTALTEAGLEDIVDRPAVVHLSVERLRLPRIRWSKASWPLSERVWRAMHRRAQELMAIGGFDLTTPSGVTFEDLEGLDLRTIWDPILKVPFGAKTG